MRRNKMALQIIVEGRLDFADGAYLITVKRPLKTRYLGYYIHPYIGKHIVISYEEPEEESVDFWEKLAKPMRRALAPA